MTYQLAPRHPHDVPVPAALQIFDSIGIGVVWFRLMKFETVLRYDQCEHGKFLSFSMKCQLEAVPQEGLKHAGFESNSLLILLDIVELTQFLSSII